MPDKDTTTPLAAFNRTVSIYQELNSASGGVQAMEYGASNSGGKATHTGNSAEVKVSRSDFVCDIETSARRSLSPLEFRYFSVYYKPAVVVVEDSREAEEGNDGCLRKHLDTFEEPLRSRIAAFDSRMRNKLGQRLITVGLYPANIYFAGKDCRGHRPTKQPWSHLYGN